MCARAKSVSPKPLAAIPKRLVGEGVCHNMRALVCLKLTTRTKQGDQIQGAEQ
jgi:hypothetical protein